MSIARNIFAGNGQDGLAGGMQSSSIDGNAFENNGRYGLQLTSFDDPDPAAGAQGNDIVPIPGTKRRSFLEQNCAAIGIQLSPAEIDALSKAFPLNVTAGTRYPEKQLSGLGI